MDILNLHQKFMQSSGISTDSRKVEKNQLFFALSGQNFDGNIFAEQALNKGAMMAIIDNKDYLKDDRYFLVPDVLVCMQKLATFHRKFLKTPIIAITGTNGKTTTKELISSVLRKKFKVTSTTGNLNNHIGVPLTLLSFTKETEIGVVEMGANHPEEIEQLCNIAFPDYGIINNIGKAHLEGFGSFEGVIRAKSELYKHCHENKKLVFVNGNDELLLRLSVDMTRISYGKTSENQVFAEFVASDPYLTLNWKNMLIHTQLVGEYNFNNAMAAIAVGEYFNIPEKDIAEALSEYKPQNNRSQLTKTNRNTLIVDAYNANPSSMDLSIRNFVNIKSEKRMLILGDMFELGEASPVEHKKILDLVTSLKFDNVIFVGENFYAFSELSNLNFRFFQSTEKLITFLSQDSVSGFTILLKASRGIKLEKVIELL